MRWVDETIQKLCPTGVTYVNLEECCEILDRYRKPVKRTARVEGSYPYYGANGIQDYVSDYIFDGDFVLVGEDGSVLTENGNPVVTWASGKIWVNNHAHVIRESGAVSLRFLFYYLQTVNISHMIHGNIPKLNQASFRSIRVPLLPIELQRLIVEILDTYTSLKAELVDELAAEKRMRAIHYAHYRDSLFEFEGNEEVQWLKLEDLFIFKNGLNKGKGFFGHGSPIVNYKDVYVGGRITQNSLQGLVEVTKQEQSRYAVERGDVFFTRTSETKEEIGLSAVLTETIPGCVFSGFVLRARPKTDLLLPEYCAYCFSTSRVRNQIIQGATLTTRALTNGKSLGKVVIPVPPLEEQQLTVSALDELKSSSDEIIQVIQAEIELRQKQYAYYLGQLFSFREKVA